MQVAVSKLQLGQFEFSGAKYEFNKLKKIFVDQMCRITSDELIKVSIEIKLRWF